jgi:predicted MFS family arabinose efflux permease
MENNTQSLPKSNHSVAQQAFRFVFILGIVSLFADITYEGARSITGPFLGSLGASAAIVGFVAGLGEMLGYALRSVSGYFTDKTRKYWTAAFLGYAVNLFAVPTLALAGSWPMAAALIVAERTGKAIRRPAMDSMLSRAGKAIGHGWVFGLHEALDQTGATLGPLIVALVLFRRGGYRHAFAMLLIPAFLCLATLVFARLLYPRPQDLEGESAPRTEPKPLPKVYRLYLIAGGLIAAGFVDFSLIAFHFQKSGTVSQELIPVYYAASMSVSAVASLILGKLLDRHGLPVLLVAFVVSAFAAPLVFFETAKAELLGMIFWGIGLAAQESCLKAVLSVIVPPDKRSTAFGIFDAGFGVAWFAGSAIMGLLYDKSILALVVFSVALQVAALPLLVVATKQAPRSSRA